MKTVELKNYRSLTENELNEINGGWVPPIIIVGGLLVAGFGVGLYDSYEASKNKKNYCP